MFRRWGMMFGLLAAVASQGRAQTVIPNSERVNPANGHTYALLTQSSWALAENTAMTLGGHLATINDAAEDQWVFNTYGMFGGTRRSLWIGLNDAAIEGQFVWASGEISTYRHFAPGEPNNFNNEDFVHIFEPAEQFGRSGLWNDNVVGGTGGSIGTIVPNGLVEIVPEPATAALVAIGALFACRRRGAM